MGNWIQRPVARFEDFEVNLETGEVWKAGRPLKIQDQPFKVLSALLERPGQIVSREELRQLIWPENSVGDFDHAINLALAKLRATLGDSADVPHLIETLPRRGYRFIAPLRERTEPKTPSPRLPVWLPTLRAAIIPALLVAAVSLGGARVEESISGPRSATPDQIPRGATTGEPFRRSRARVLRGRHDGRTHHHARQEL